MPVKFLSDIEVKAGLRDSSGSLGASGQILSSTSGNVSWVTPTINTVARDVQNQVKAGVAINKGQAVYVTGADGTNIIVGLASNTSEATSSKTLGLLNATVSVNGSADVVQIGRLSGLNTIGATAGDPVWLGTNGNLIYGLINKPYAPAHLVFIGIVTRVNANNGEIFVNVQNGFELNEIHDVDLKTNVPINGDVLGYDGTLWVNKTIAQWLGYTPANASGTTNYVSKFTGSTSLGNSQIFDNGTNVGIGTTSPTSKLDIAGSGDVIGTIRTNNSNGVALFTTINDLGNTTEIGTWGSTRSAYGVIQPNNGYIYSGVDFSIGSLTNIKFGTGASNSERMRIDSSGNVGIGTTSPSGKLDVQLDTTGDHLVRTWNTNTSGTGKAIIRIANSGNNAQGSQIQFTDNDYYVGTLTADRTNGMAFYVGQQGSPLASERMRIASNGNVGIGTTNPAYKLDVVGSNPRLRVKDSSTNSSIIDIEGGGGSFYLGTDNSSGSSFGGSAYAGTLYRSGAYPISMWTNGLERMRITSAGNVGIGTTTPSAPLAIGRVNSASEGGQIDLCRATDNASSWGIDVYGSTSTPALRLVDNVASSTRMIIDGSGNVGIGTGSPEACALLHVDTREKGFLPPRMDTGQRNSIPSPVEGLMVWNYDTKRIEVYDGSSWREIAWV